MDNVSAERRRDMLSDNPGNCGVRVRSGVSLGAGLTAGLARQSRTVTAPATAGLCFAVGLVAGSG